MCLKSKKHNKHWKLDCWAFPHLPFSRCEGGNIAVYVSGGGNKIQEHGIMVQKSY